MMSEIEKLEQLLAEANTRADNERERSEAAIDKERQRSEAAIWRFHTFIGIVSWLFVVYKIDCIGITT